MQQRFLALMAMLAATATPALAEDVPGRWTGAIDNHLHALIQIERAADGTYSGTFSDHEQPVTQPDAQAVADAPLTNITATPYRLSFVVPAIGDAVFDGTWNDTTQRWVGTFQWGKDGYVSHLTLRRTQATTLADALKPRPPASLAQERTEMNTLIDGYVRDQRFMGSILVTRKGKVLIDEGYGLADVANAVPNTPQTGYQIASITKPFTATAILILQDHGKLSIDDPIGRYIPDAPATWEGITLRHLLSHTSGLGDHNPLMKGHFAEDHTPAQLLDLIRTLPLDSAPGKTYQYSNAGYTLLGVVIEKVSGQSYGDYLHDNIFVPLHMDATAYNPPQAGNIAHGHDVGETGPVASEPRNLTTAFSAGGLVSTTHDLLKWQKALFGGKLISKTALAEMTSQGLGLALTPVDDQTLYSHSGHLPGFVSDAAYQPQDGLSVIVLGNLDNSTPLWLSRGLTTIAHGLPAEVVPQPTAIKVSPDILTQYAGTYMLMPGMELVVTVENGHLLVQATDQNKVAAYPESETLFFAKTVEAKLEFVRNGDGTISCILHQSGQDIRGVRKP